MACDLSPEIVYEDGSVVVVVKPRGMISEEKNSDSGKSLPEWIKNYFTLKKEENDVYPVHRLDAGTRGLMVFARTKEAAAGLSEAVREGRLVKEYEALLHGDPGCGEGGSELRDILFKDSAKNKVFVVKTLRKGAREAKLFYTVSELRGKDAIVRVRLVTGRTHQIRVQFASRGFPLFGDRKYGAKDDVKHICLCAVMIEFPHPVTGRVLRFEIESGI